MSRIVHPLFVALTLFVVAVPAIGSAPRDPAVEAARVLGELEFTGILELGERREFCLQHRTTGHAQWLVVGGEADGLRVVSYDPTREVVEVRYGAARREIAMREAKVTAQIVARTADGSVDWAHMRLSEKEKEREAELLMWDILEVGRKARLARSTRAAND
ncbi:hypothetical protein ASA1KI_25400 [Opitutales bacterium ASA1]|uniref:hypothetical protein n=1 Tax=Congregicoccus parvus TaxID=3081749 RepID=UPI002B2BC4B3|nr:hypothetical protein ASA1KI_25400 [Opitutales bacterium ASA1]